MGRVPGVREWPASAHRMGQPLDSDADHIPLLDRARHGTRYQVTKESAAMVDYSLGTVEVSLSPMERFEEYLQSRGKRVTQSMWRQMIG